jgi:hypothetical protein
MFVAAGTVILRAEERPWGLKGVVLDRIPSGTAAPGPRHAAGSNRARRLIAAPT